MKYILLVLLLAGCTTTVPVTQKFPEAPQVLLEPCKPLQEVPPTATLSEFAKTVAQNYTEYYQCSNIVDGWHDWYKQQSQIFKELK